MHYIKKIHHNLSNYNNQIPQIAQFPNMHTRINSLTTNSSMQLSKKYIYPYNITHKNLKILTPEYMLLMLCVFLTTNK